VTTSGFGFDPVAAVDHLRVSDAVFARSIDRIGPFAMQLKSAPDIFFALAEAIVYQQLTGKAAETIFSRVHALFPRTGLSASRILRTPDENLRGAGLSRAKVLALRDLAQKATDGTLPTLAEARDLDDATLIERLIEVRGIGRWTAEMLLMFHLGRPDVLPADDYGIRKGFAVAFRKRELPSRADVLARGMRWQPFRSVASWYLWRIAERSPARESRA